MQHHSHSILNSFDFLLSSWISYATQFFVFIWNLLCRSMTVSVSPFFDIRIHIQPASDFVCLVMFRLCFWESIICSHDKSNPARRMRITVNNKYAINFNEYIYIYLCIFIQFRIDSIFMGIEEGPRRSPDSFRVVASLCQVHIGIDI